MTDWLVQNEPRTLAARNLGPALIHLGEAPEKGRSANEIFLTPVTDSFLHYTVFQKDREKPIKKGVVKEGEFFDPGCKMAMQFKVLRYLTAAVEDWDVQKLEYPTSRTTSAIKVVFDGKEHWVF